MLLSACSVNVLAQNDCAEYGNLTNENEMICILDAYGLLLHSKTIPTERLESEVAGKNGSPGFGQKAMRIKIELEIADQKLALIQNCVVSSVESN